MTIAAKSPTTGLEYLKKHVKLLLKNTVFVGSFQEKRFVEHLNAYRDIITITPEEEDFITTLQIVKRKLDSELLYKSWIGITIPDTIGAPVGCNLWVVLPEEVFGKYWYRVKTVEFLQNEVRLKLEIIRCYQREITPVRNTDEPTENLLMLLQEKKSQIEENVLYFFKYQLTWHNTKKTLIFLSVLVSAMIAGFFSVTQYALEYVLKFMREFSGLVKAMTPLIVNILYVVGRCVFGFYQLIHALFQRKPAPVYNNYINFDPQNGFTNPQLNYNYYNRRALPAYPTPRSRGPRITPLD